MKPSKIITRRSFIEKATMTAGLATIGTGHVFGQTSGLGDSQVKLPREVWIATVSQQGMNMDTPEAMVQAIFSILKKSLAHSPDIICLPEVFMTFTIRGKISRQEELDRSDKLMKDFMSFARTNNCYVICPVYTAEKGKVYNSAVLIDRQGNRMGEYRKIHLTEGEIAGGLTPGPLQPPVFKTDFGIIGMQICFDIEWDDGWKALRQQGAEMVFWPSAFAGGQAVNTKAWQNKYVVVSSTRKDTTKICDITGETVAQTGSFERNLIVAPVNLEKEFLHSWPFNQYFDAIRAKYGRKVRITTFYEEEWSIIESLSPDVKVKDILAEFKIQTYEQMMQAAEIAQIKARG